ncbi:MAG: hypothetical protein M1510_13510 [Nitrospirae bacterium]|nr:hypothetical protein [Nitrospirota bacterium]MCL5237662.1 hypothetical protein [Nitrospirota bacterium]
MEEIINHKTANKNSLLVTRHPLLNRGGYTLLELLLSIFLIGLILLIVGGAMRLGFRSVDSGERRIESLERFKSSLNIINSQIQSAILITLKEDKEGDLDTGEKRYLFKGDRESMQFPTNYSLWGNRRGYVIVTYQVESGGQGKWMLRATEGLIGAEKGKETKLFDLLDGIHFEYFFKDPLEEKGRWVEQWTDKASIPEKVKVHLAEGTRKLSLIIPVRARGSLLTTVTRNE